MIKHNNQHTQRKKGLGLCGSVVLLAQLTFMGEAIRRSIIVDSSQDYRAFSEMITRTKITLLSHSDLSRKLSISHVKTALTINFMPADIISSLHRLMSRV